MLKVCFKHWWDYSRDGISLNIIGYAADTTNVKFGEHKCGFTLERKNPRHLMRCICHSAHLCASHAYEKLRIPRTAEELRDVYNYYSHSAKCQAEFRAIQTFAELKPHKLLRPCQTHWLSLHACISRVIEQWDVLIQYFQPVVDQITCLCLKRSWHIYAALFGRYTWFCAP